MFTSPPEPPTPALAARCAAAALTLLISGCGGIPVERVAYNRALHPSARSATPQPRALAPKPALSSRQRTLRVALTQGITLNSSPTLRDSPAPPAERLVVFDGDGDDQWHAWLEFPLHRLIPTSSRVRTAKLNLELIQRWSSRSPRTFTVCLTDAPPPGRWSWDAQPAHTCTPPSGTPLNIAHNDLYASADLSAIIQTWRERDPDRPLWIVLKPAPPPKDAPPLDPAVLNRSAIEARGIDLNRPERQPHIELTLEL